MPQQSAAKTQEQQQQPAMSGALAGYSSEPAISDSLIFALQRTAGNRVVSEWLQSGPGYSGAETLEASAAPKEKPLMPARAIQKKANNSGPDDPAEQQADRAADEAVKQPEAAQPTKSLIVDDKVVDLQPGQMKKSEFLSLLRTSVCTAAEEALSGTMWSAMGCPYIDRWLDHYSNQSSQHLERALLKYAPDAAAANSAQEYIPIITRRLQIGIEQWKKTGEVTGVPEELASGGMPGATAEGLIGGLLGGALSAVGSAVSGLVSGAGRALSTLGEMAFKERDGGATEPSDPTEIQAQLGSGRSLDGTLKSRMESAYGANFSGVRIHTDKKAHELSENLNARAFTIGGDIAFGAGEYHPGTVVGDALIAHELAHVVQQGAGSSATSPQTKRGPANSGLEEDADLAAAGAVISVWGGAQAVPRELQTKAQPRRRSGLRLQRCGSTKKEVKQPEKTVSEADLKAAAEEAAHARFRSETLVARDKKLTEAGTNLRDLGAWARDEQRRQGLPKITGVVGLDPKQHANATQALAKLQSIGPSFETKGLDAVIAKLQEATANAKSAKKFIGNPEPEFQNQMKIALIHAGDSLDEALAALEKMNDSVDGYELSKEIESARAILDAAKGSADPYEAIEEFDKKLKGIRDQIRALQEKYKRYPKAIERIAFVVQYFIAVNTPGFSGLPSADEIKKFKGSLSGGLSSDFALVFGGEGVYSPFELFIAYADILDKQLAVLDQMSTARTPARNPIPAQGEIEAYFRTLRRASNDDVVDAYQQYARAYFYHRVITQIEDMAVTDVAELYSRPLSVTGTRPLVCSGYAILGAHLLTLAGGKVTRFISAVRATDEDIKRNKIDDGHAVAVVTRGGATFFVSNDSIFDTEERALDVAWAHPNAPLIQASGPTNNEALAALRAELAKKM